jgi:phospholipase/carboxylesterase
MERSNADAPVVIETRPDCDASVIWLHGLGADGHDFEPIVPELGLSRDLGVRFIFPHAPKRPVTVNAGMVMRAWYDMAPVAGGFEEDRDELQESASRVMALIDGEHARGIARERIVIAGFSQGGVLALYTALQLPWQPAGAIAMSCWMADFDTSRNAVGLRVFMGHGRDDPLVPYARGQEARDRLQKLGAEVEWHDYPMGHSVCPREIDDIANWLRRRLPV